MWPLSSTYSVTSGGFYSFGLPVYYTDQEHFSATTPKFSLDYAINDSSNVYATAAKGFRLGGPTGPDPANVPGGTCDGDYETLGISVPPTKYQSDSLWSYELGSKGRYAGNRVSVNAAVYAIDWTNIQQTVNLPTCGFGFTTNVGDAKIYGSELELRVLAHPLADFGAECRHHARLYLVGYRFGVGHRQCGRVHSERAQVQHYTERGLRSPRRRQHLGVRPGRFPLYRPGKGRISTVAG